MPFSTNSQQSWRKKYIREIYNFPLTVSPKDFLFAAPKHVTVTFTRLEKIATILFLLLSLSPCARGWMQQFLALTDEGSDESRWRKEGSTKNTIYGSSFSNNILARSQHHTLIIQGWILHWKHRCEFNTELHCDTVTMCSAFHWTHAHASLHRFIDNTARLDAHKWLI